MSQLNELGSVGLQTIIYHHLVHKYHIHFRHTTVMMISIPVSIPKVILGGSIIFSLANETKEKILFIHKNIMWKALRKGLGNGHTLSVKIITSWMQRYWNNYIKLKSSCAPCQQETLHSSLIIFNFLLVFFLSSGCMVVFPSGSLLIPVHAMSQ